jgi:membrane protease YdiL (CAAX protease family)
VEFERRTAFVTNAGAGVDGQAKPEPATESHLLRTNHLSMSRTLTPTSKSFLVLFIIFVIPILAILIYPPILALRHFYLIAVIAYVFVTSRHHMLDVFRQSLSPISLHHSFTPLFIPTLLFLIFTPLTVILFPQLFYKPIMLFLGIPVSIWATLIGYFWISVPLQEIIFRFLLQHHLQNIIHKPIVLHLVNATIFGLAHLPFGSPPVAMATAILGYIWSHNYYTHKNIITISLSHATLGSYLIICLYFFLP